MNSLFICLFLLTFHATGTIGSNDSIKFVAIIFRHGDRTPVDCYPTDPYNNESLWPVGFGQLTNRGKKQQFVFGQSLRTQYVDVVPAVFDPKEIYVRSTDVDRTLMSVQANLAGFFPPSGSSIWNKDLAWQPIPVHTEPEAEDALLAMKKPCPVYDKEYQDYTSSGPFKARLRHYGALMNFLTQKTGMEVKTYGDVLDIYSTLYIENLYNFTLPRWTRLVYPNMRDPACYSFTVDTGTPKMARLKVGPLVQHIHKHLMMAVSAKKNKKYQMLQLYSAHDLTVGSVLNALGLYDGNCPVYTSAVFFELIQDGATSQHFVRILYRNTTGTGKPFVLSIPNCGTKCPVENFTLLYQNLITVNRDAECYDRTKIIATYLMGGTFVVILVGYLSRSRRSAKVYHAEI